MRKSPDTVGKGSEFWGRSLDEPLARAEKETYVYKGKTYRGHPAAHVFSRLEGRRYREFVDNVKAKGLQRPVVLFRDRILDGWNLIRGAAPKGR